MSTFTVTTPASSVKATNITGRPFTRTGKNSTWVTNSFGDATWAVRRLREAGHEASSVAAPADSPTGEAEALQRVLDAREALKQALARLGLGGNIDDDLEAVRRLWRNGDGVSVTMLAKVMGVTRSYLSTRLNSPT